MKVLLCETGGTFSMGSVTGFLLKKIDSNLKLDDQKAYAYPLYDSRHFSVAAAIANSTSIPSSVKNQLFLKLVSLGDVVVSSAIASKKNDTNAMKKYKSQHGVALNKIIAEIFKSSNYTIGKLFQEYGLSQSSSLRPYNIDSIDYSMEAHYPLLLKNVTSVLRDAANTTVIVIGGTDTQEFYAGLLAREIDRLGLLSQNNKIVFLSSMLSFGYDPTNVELTNVKKAIHPAHIGRYFLSAIKFSLLPESGAFALAADDEAVTSVFAHDLQNQYVKISANLPNAFRSKNYFGRIVFDTAGSTFHKNPLYFKKQNDFPYRRISQNYSMVAPPLVGNFEIQTLNAYLNSVGYNFDHIILPLTDELVRSVQYKYNKNAENTLFVLLQLLTNAGVFITWLDESYYQHDSQEIGNALFRSGYSYRYFVEKFISHNNTRMVSNETMIGAYLDAILTGGTAKHSKQLIPAIAKKVPVIGIKYIPDDSFNIMLSLIAQYAESVVISALPGEVIPERYLNSIGSLLNKNVSVYVCFKYNGLEHFIHGEKIIEGEQSNHYAAAQPLIKMGVQVCGPESPEDKIKKLQIQSHTQYNFWLQARSSFSVGMVSGFSDSFVTKFWGKEYGEKANIAASAIAMSALDYSSQNIAMFISVQFALEWVGFPKKYASYLSWTIMLLSLMVDLNPKAMLINMLLAMSANFFGDQVGRTIGKASANSVGFFFNPQRNDYQEQASTTSQRLHMD